MFQRSRITIQQPTSTFRRIVSSVVVILFVGMYSSRGIVTAFTTTTAKKPTTFLANSRRTTQLYYEKQPFISSSGVTVSSSTTSSEERINSKGFSSLSATTMTASSSLSTSADLLDATVEVTTSNDYWNDLIGQQQSSTSWWTTTILPILSTSLLITSNTVGAGCLVLPELIESGPGLLPSAGIFTTAYIINLLSGLMIAQIAITQKEQSQSIDETPSSFKEFTRVNLNSDTAANMVSMISLFVNACVLSFDLNRIGTIGTTLLSSSPISSAITSMLSITSVLSLPNIISIIWGTGIISLLCTQTSQRLSQFSNILVTALFVSFGGLLIPGLCNVQDPIGTILTPPANWDSLPAVAPIILMSMIYQNIVPTVTKLLDYNRFQTVASISIGSFIPFVLYMSWIYACLGHGIDTSIITSPSSGAADAMMNHHNDIASSILLPIFSVVTIAGSTLCGGVSMSEEIESFLPKKKNDDDDGLKTATTEAPAAFQIPSAIPSVLVPLLASFMFAGADGNGLTGALTLAGSIGSPLLYGAIPAYIAYQQLSSSSSERTPQQQQQQAYSCWWGLMKEPTMETTKPLVPTATLPMLGALSIGYVSQEAIQRVTEMLSFVS